MKSEEGNQDRKEVQYVCVHKSKKKKKKSPKHFFQKHFPLFIPRKKGIFIPNKKIK